MGNQPGANPGRHLCSSADDLYGRDVLHHGHVFLSQREDIDPEVPKRQPLFSLSCLWHPGAGFKGNAVMLPMVILIYDLFLMQGVTKRNIKDIPFSADCHPYHPHSRHVNCRSIIL